MIESAKERAEVHFSTRLQAQQMFVSARRVEVDFTPPLLCAGRNLFGPRYGVPESICKAHGITSCR